MTTSEPSSAAAHGSEQLRTIARTSGDRWLLAGLLVFTLIVRGAVLWAMRGNLEQDPDAYREIAENLLVHDEFALGKPNSGDVVRPTAYRPPLYPIALSNLPAADRQRVSLLKVAFLHLVLGVATVWLTWATAHRVGQAALGRAGPPSPHDSNWWAVGRRPPLRGGARALSPPTIAGLIVACDPILLNQQTLVMTETLAAFLAILSLWCLARFDTARMPFNAAMAGGAIGLAILCRPTFLPWLGQVGIALLFVRGGPAPKSQISNFKFRNLPWRLANLAGLAIIAAGVVSPWAIRNYREFGKSIITTTHGGYTLLLGNNSSFYEWLERDETGLPWDAEGRRSVDSFVIGDRHFAHNKWSNWLVLQDEIEFDSTSYKMAFETIREHPKSFARACFYRVLQLWSPLPHKLTADESTNRRWLRYATCAWYCGVYALATIGLWRLRWKLFQPPLLWGFLLCLAFTAVHAFYWTNLRMRAPLMPFMAIVAAAGVGSMLKVQCPKLRHPEP